MNTRRFVAYGTTALILALTGCATDPDTADAPDGTAAAATFPVTVETANGPLTLDERPEAIVSMSATATEMLFAIDADDQVIAVDDQSDHPAEVPVTDLSAFTPNVEAIAGYAPDLVVISSDSNGLLDGLTAIDIPVLLLPAATTLDDSYDQLDQLGDLTGHPAEADTVAEEMRSEIAEIVEATPAPAEPLSIYHELDSTFYSASSETFIGQVYALFGLTNIADTAAAAAGSEYPQLSAEYIVDADPDLIFLADTECCAQDAATVAARPAWAELTAVRTGGIVEMDDDVASRWGPRVVELVRIVGESVAGRA